MLVSEIISRVHHALEQFGGDCPKEEVVGLCPDLTWNQVHLAIDYLSRTGQVRVTMDANKRYKVQASHPVAEVSEVRSA